MSPETRDFLGAVRDADNPSPADEQRVLRSVRTAIATGAVSGAAATVAAAMSGTAPGSLATGLGKSALLLGSKAQLGAKGLGLGKVLTVVLGSKWTVGLLCAATVVGVEAAEPLPEASVVTVLSSQGLARQVLATPLVVERVEPGPLALPPLLSVPEQSMPVPSPPTAARESASQPRAAEPNAVKPNAVEPVEAEPVEAELGAAEPGAAEATAVGTSAEGSVVRELRLLQHVQAALRQGDGQTALEALNTHQDADPKWRAERWAARILALCSLGRVEEARRQAERFARHYPKSMHQAAIADSCVKR